MSQGASLTDFWRDCHGVGELRLLVDRPGQMAQGIVLQTPYALLGRDDLCDIVVKTPDVSRRHVYLQVIAGHLWGFDLASRAGIYWGEQRYAAGVVTPAESLRVGACRLQPLTHGDEPIAPDADPLAASPAASDPLPTVALEFLNAAQQGGGPAPGWQLDRTLTFVGQALQCKVRFKCPSVSRIHCAMLRTPGGVWVVDLLGRDGVDIDGTRVRWAKLCDGQQLRVGRFRMLVREQQRRSGRDDERATMLALEPREPREAPEAHEALREGTALAALTPTATFFLGGMPAPTQPSQALTPQALTPTPNLPAGMDPTQAVLLTMMNQFSNMQQQMFDQFQQTTMMMMQMFGSLQKDQFELVRQELDGLRELNREINTLQGELARHKAETPTKPAAPAAAPSRSRGASRRTAPRSGSLRPSSPQADDAAAADVRAATPTPAAAEPMPAPPSTAPAPDAAPPQSVPAASLNTAAPVSGGPPGEDVHEWLVQRFADLQQERQTRWQRLMGVLTGK